MSGFLAVAAFTQTLGVSVPVAGFLAIYRPAWGETLGGYAACATIVSVLLAIALAPKNREEGLLNYLLAGAMGVSASVLTPLVLFIAVPRILLLVDRLIRQTLN